MSRYIDVNLDLLDRRIVDVDGEHVGKVDDVEVDLDAEGGPAITHLLVGVEALGGRFGSRLGDWIAAIGRIRIGRHDPIAIPVDLVTDIGNVVTLSVSWDRFPATRRSEQWFAEHFIGRIPGGRDASD